MKKSTARALRLVLWAALMAGSVGAHAAGTADPAGKLKKKPARTAKITVIPGSAETAAERSARLRRECRGRVNAGACAGYTAG